MDKFNGVIKQVHPEVRKIVNFDPRTKKL